MEPSNEGVTNKECRRHIITAEQRMQRKIVPNAYYNKMKKNPENPEFVLNTFALLTQTYIQVSR